MSQLAIVEKLRQELLEKIVSERQVMYILVETRKLLNILNQTKAFSVLSFHCNWALHHSLDQDAAKNLITELNDSYRALGEGATAERGAKVLWDKLGLDIFRKQLRGFLRHHQLPADLCEDGDWQSFLHHYSKIIQDSPLICSQRAAVAGITFDRLVLTAVDTGINMLGIEEIAIRWTFYLKDEQVADWTFRPGRALIGRTFFRKDSPPR
jgi:hypothetical protein